MAATIKMSFEADVGSGIGIGHPLATIFIKVVAAQPDRHPRLVFAAVQVDVGGQHKVHVLGFEA